MRLWKSPSVGDEIDSRCPRCSDETIHRVVAIVEGSIHLVICTRCNSQHRHRPSPLAAKKRVPLPTERQAKVLLKYRASQSPKRKSPLPEWQNLRDTAGETQPAPYDQSKPYIEGQAIEHPAFGLGFVCRVTGPRRIEVVFANQMKVLVMNRPKPTEGRSDE